MSQTCDKKHAISLKFKENTNFVVSKKESELHVV